MPVPSVVHEKELQRVAQQSYVSKAFRVALIDAPGNTFDANDSFASIMAGEVEAGKAGYARQQITFTPSDIGSYDSGKVPLARKAATFAHDGTPNQTIRFSHVVMIAPGDSEVVCVTKLAGRATLSDGQVAVFYFDFNLYGVFVAQTGL